MAASTSTAADSTNNIRYDVFISHRGPDVKKTFASHLYRRLKSHGLQVFLDYEELQGGEELTDQIKGAIRTASVHVAIFPPNYADSKWCLDELVFMLESGAPIIPVFHHVNPADLRWTQGEGEGVYSRSLRNLEKKRAYDSQPRYNSKTIENWRNALSSAADISGLDLKAFDGDEGALLDKVVEVVLKKGVKTQLNVARYPTGLDEKVKDFEKKALLQQHSGRAQLVGITGFGGVGKTTLAKELFNSKSSNYCKSYFLFDIREKAKNSLHSLQRELLKGLFQRDMPVDNKDEGIEMLKKLLPSFPVLLVLDDVDKVDQVESLLPVDVDVLHHDSFILITSRDKNILVRSRVQESSIYKLTGMDTKRSRELFCSHAFCQPHPPSRFEPMVNRFLKACDGLPLSLKVFGGLLYGNTDTSSWEDELERLEQILPDEIQERLQISYDALPRDEQQMFLDIACFFIGENRDTVIRVWDGSGWKGARGFQSLMNKCLVEVDINGYNYFWGEGIENCIRMHDHLRDLGRALANAKGSGLPCRLWRGKKDMDDFLQQSYETTKVRGIQYHKYWHASHDDERPSFSRYKMKNLQLLDTDIEEDLLKCLLEGVDSPELLWFRWRNWSSSLLPCIPMKKLWVLEVDGYGLEVWPEELQAPLQLRELRIRARRFKIPKFIGQLTRLERMVVTSRWIEMPKEFCHLRSLKHLKLESATMSSLPDSFGNLSTLEHIDLSRSYLKTLPHSFGNLSTLEHIDLSQSYLKTLPDSFGNLSMLEHIDLSGSTQLERLPESFGNLIKLKYLDLKGCYNLTHSSGPFGKISTLEYIDLTECHKIEVLPFQILHQGFREELCLELLNLKEWPSAGGESSPLEKLVLKTPSLEMLPPSLGRDLRNLKYLKLRGCRSLKRLPDSFLLLNQLTEWIVEDCSLQELRFKTFEGESETLNTESKGQMSLLRLQHLRLFNTEISKISFPTGICPNLQHLQIQNCNDLVEVGTLPTALVNLEVAFDISELQKLSTRRCEEELPSIETLVSLEESQLFECVKLKNIQGLRQLTQLRELNVDGCSELEELSGLEHLRSLEELSAGYCVKLKSIRFSAQLTQLLKLDVDGCSELEELSGLEHLRSLVKLSAGYCVKLKSIRFSVQLTELRELNVSRCSELEELPGLEHLSSLEKLSAYECVKLKSIQGLAQLTQLRKLYVYGCSELEELPGLECLRSLERLWAFKCTKLKSIRFSVQLINLLELYVYGCSELEEIPGLEQVMSLEKLWAFQCVKLKSVQGLAHLTQLRELYVYGCSELEELPGLECLRSLERLWAFKCTKLKSIRFSVQLIYLLELHVSGCSELEELPGLEHLSSLEMLCAFECVKLKSMQGLSHLTRLRQLHIYGCSELEELPGLECLRSLERLWAFKCTKLKSIRFSVQLINLLELNVSGCSELEELPGLEHLSSLEMLCAFECVKLKSMQGLAQLTQLRELYVYDARS